jgi:hypothetical protein
MTCTHSAACPLFPLLNARFEGWRQHYCDSDAGWRDCARYQQSVRGQHVPLSLLPNGRDALYLAQRARSESLLPAPGDRAAGTPTLADLMFEQPVSPDPGTLIRMSDPPSLPERFPRPRTSPARERPPPAVRASVHRTRPDTHWWNRLGEWMRRPL